MREADFSERIKTILCERVGGRCSNPNCRRETLGPHREGDKRLSIGEAAHILGASPKGARYDARMTKEERESINNGIWLCSACHTLIDKNPDEYPVEELQRISSGNLVLLAITFGASSLLVYMSTTFNLLRNKKYLRPSFKCFDKKMVKDINQLGLKFFIAQIAFVVLYTTDNIIVSKYFGAAQVTPFSLVDKVFNIGYSVFAAFLIPYWSKTTAELASHNFDGIRKYFRNLNILALFFSCGCIAVAFIFRPVVNAWLGKTIEFSNELIGVMCIYYCIYSFCGVSSPIINGLGAVNGVMLLGIFQGIVNIPLSIYLATDGGLGIVGVRFATLILVSIGAVYQFIYFYYTLNKLEKKETLRSGGLHE